MRKMPKGMEDLPLKMMRFDTDLQRLKKAAYSFNLEEVKSLVPDMIGQVEYVQRKILRPIIRPEEGKDLVKSEFQNIVEWMIWFEKKGIREMEKATESASSIVTFLSICISFRNIILDTCETYVQTEKDFRKILKNKAGTFPLLSSEIRKSLAREKRSAKRAKKKMKKKKGK